MNWRTAAGCFLAAALAGAGVSRGADVPLVGVTTNSPSPRAPLMTRWAAEVNATNSHPEYPRPQMVRADWLNLNGLWDYAVLPTEAHLPTNFAGKILVPFPIESALSGVTNHLDENSTLWYRRAFSVPTAWHDRRVRLQCGAADWQCRVFVNGRLVGQHRGGFDPFGFDITDFLTWGAAEEVIMAVTDPTEGDQPRGKQARKPEGIFYSACSGIWQTVWLEPVFRPGIDQLKLTPDVDGQRLRVRVAVGSLDETLRVEVVATFGGQEAGRVSGLPNAELSLSIAQPKLWSPDDPALYDLRVTLFDGDRPLDQVSSYFGMRKVSLLTDKEGVTRIALNDQPLFEIGALDQGFWPDGVYTAPTDEALRSDIAFLKAAGFNLARKHVKVEPSRWYYWCDRLGLLVWQDMPSGNNATAEGRREFETELLQMLRNLHNHPSIILWVLFNESWGQYDTQRLTQRIKSLDPSRLVDNASGWTDSRTGDIADVHNYPAPDAPEPGPSRATVLGEFGGLGLPITNHLWSSHFWGYRLLTNTPALANAYAQLIEDVWTLRQQRGLSAAVYTQTTDVETECNGLLTYDRAIAKLDPATIAAANEIARNGLHAQVLASDALLGRSVWRYAFDLPAANWFMPGYDDSKWLEGPAGFGTRNTKGARVNTVWQTADIWLRREFTLAEAPSGVPQLHMHHDEDVEVYLNGVLALSLPGFITAYTKFDVAPAAVATLKPGRNVIAVHCHQTTGGQYIDVGLIVPISPETPAHSVDLENLPR